MVNCDHAWGNYIKHNFTISLLEYHTCNMVFFYFSQSFWLFEKLTTFFWQRNSSFLSHFKCFYAIFTPQSGFVFTNISFVFLLSFHHIDSFCIIISINSEGVICVNCVWCISWLPLLYFKTKQTRNLPHLQRFHGKEEVKAGGRYTISLEEDQKLYHMARLEISKVITGDKGEYRAVARNKHGEGVATINLNFEGSGKPKYAISLPHFFRMFRCLNSNTIYCSFSSITQEFQMANRHVSPKNQPFGKKVTFL